jgi:hypothetical protein
VSPYRYRSLAAELAVTATGVATQQSRHFRTALGGDSKEMLAAVRAATRAVMAGGSDLVTTRLDDLPDMVRRGILDKKRRRGRLDVQIELEIARRFALRTDEMAHRCIELARLSLKVSPGEGSARFLSRVGRSYIAGLFPESIVMCRAALEQAVLERFRRTKKPLPNSDGSSEMKARLNRSEDLGWLTRRQRDDAWKIWLRGNKAIHEDPHLTADAFGTIVATMAILDALHSDHEAA